MEYHHKKGVKMYKSDKTFTKKTVSGPRQFWEKLDKKADAHNFTRSAFIRFLFNFYVQLRDTLEVDISQLELEKGGE